MQHAHKTTFTPPEKNKELLPHFHLSHENKKRVTFHHVFLKSDAYSAYNGLLYSSWKVDGTLPTY